MNENIFYEQELTTNSDSFYWYNAKPCAEYKFYNKTRWGVERIGYAYDDKNADGNLERPFFWNKEYNKIYDEYLKTKKNNNKNKNK